MKKISYLTLILFLCTALFSQTPSSAILNWDRVWGSGGDDYSAAACGDGSGGYVFTGTTNGSGGIAPASYGFTDVAAVHYDANGDILWSKVYGGAGFEGPSSITQVSGGYIIAGASSSGLPFISGGVVKSTYNGGIADMLVMKIDNAGNTIWYGHYGGVKEDIATGCIDNGDGSVIIGGYSKSGSGDFFGMNKGGYDMAMLRIDINTGDVLGANEFGGSADEQIMALHKGTGSDILFTGNTASSDGDLASTTAHGTDDAIMLSMNSTITTKIAVVRLGGSSSDYGTDIVYTGSGYVMTGFTYSDDFAGAVDGFSDLFVSTISDTYTATSTTLYGGDSEDLGGKLLYRNMSGQENIIVTSYAYSSNILEAYNHGVADVFVMSLDYPSLNVRYARMFGGNDDDRTTGVFIANPASTSYIVHGSTFSTAIAGGPNGDISFKRTSTSTGDLGYEDYWILNISDGFTYYADTDNDGYGNSGAGITSVSVTPPAGYAIDNSDCNDENALINPGAPEICNSLDDDCDGLSDDADPSAGDKPVWYADADMDGYGNADISVTSCAIPEGYVADLSDCADDDLFINPAASEVCNAIDDNCNNLSDEDLIFNTWYADADHDGYGDAAISISTCDLTLPDYSSDNSDCDDAFPTTHPSAPELCNAIDDDCNSIIDDVVEAILSPVGEISICKGSTTFLSATEGPGYTYAWTKDGIAFALHDATFTTMKAGIYQVTISSADGCSDISNEVTIVVNNNPKTILTTGITDLCFTSNVLLKAKNAPGNTYQWIKDGADLEGYTGNVYHASVPGIYQFRQTNASGCSRLSPTAEVFNSCREAALKTYSLYPNPSNGNFMIQASVEPFLKEAFIIITDAIGNIIYEKNIAVNAGVINEEIILEQSIAAGLYIINLHTNTNDYMQQLVVNR